MKLAEYRTSAVATIPSRPSSPSVGYPTPGNPATGTPATRPGAYWHYQLQAELEGVLTAAGLTPSATSLTQLTAAFRAIVAQECPRLLATNGWQQLPGGLIIQWGVGGCAIAGTVVTFPVAFPGGCFVVLAGDFLSSPVSTKHYQGVYNATLTGFTAYPDTDPTPSLDTFYWLSVGY